MFGRRPRHSTVVAYLALFLALGGVGYAKFSLPGDSVGTRQIRNQAVTLPKISNSARSALRGTRGATGAPCSPSNPACRGPAGPGAIGMFIDTGTAVSNKTLAKVGAWTIELTCLKSGSTTTMKVDAVGPSDTVADGEYDGLAYSYFRNPITALAPDLSLATSFGYHTSEMTLYSPTKGSAHVSLYMYAQAPSATFRCKVNASAYPVG